ncbi:MAG: UDP-N-acetylmuramoyl-L-alanine--D-glutamate ligase [Treponema sp.]|jgi:UDP-N-acetylmuramoylalanine--D-glutamate ligase|nr:UDP-N-acetylmuramoyl-L-alanine--D-glutamate ligase [Treponema sp.]
MEDFSGRRVLIMGLGLHGGGLESAKYLARHGAELTITDLRDEKTLAPSIEKLEAALGGGEVRYVLGRHETADFERADLVVKNPGVSPDSPYLKAARRIETDISLFLAASPARLCAVTGSKGKSGTASALYWVLSQARDRGPAAAVLPGTAALRGKAALPGKAWLGGNITVSPLSFLDQTGDGDDVVLELSSWQLADLRGRVREGPLLKPRCAVITAIMPDHMDRYRRMEDYVADKRVICQGQDSGDATIAGRDPWGESFFAESRGRPLGYGNEKPGPGISGGWIDGEGGPGLARFFEGPALEGGLAAGEIAELVPAELLVPGRHQKQNLLAAALALLDLGLPADFIRESLGRFPGIEHRLEFFHQAGGLRFYNDTAATVPEAARAAVEALEGRGRVLLAAGGSDKGLDLGPLADAAGKAAALSLLAGAGSEKLKPLLRDRGVPFLGPFDSVDAAVKALLEASRPGDIIVLSPGCASFGMFRNEFERGAMWKEAVRRLAAV